VRAVEREVEVSRSEVAKSSWRGVAVMKLLVLWMVMERKGADRLRGQTRLILLRPG